MCVDVCVRVDVCVDVWLCGCVCMCVDVCACARTCVDECASVDQCSRVDECACMDVRVWIYCFLEVDECAHELAIVRALSRSRCIPIASKPPFQHSIPIVSKPPFQHSEQARPPSLLPPSCPWKRAGAEFASEVARAALLLETLANRLPATHLCSRLPPA